MLPGPLLPHHCALQVRTGLEGGGGDGWGQARPKPEGPEGGTFLVPAPSLVLLSVSISQARCLPIPLIPANNSPWAKFSTPSIFLMAHELRMTFPFLNS